MITLASERADGVLDAFRRAAAGMPWYRTLLDEHGVCAGQIGDLATFSSRCPILTKANTFDRFPLQDLAATTAITDLAGVLTSSGHGGRFSFGLNTRSQSAAAARMIDIALDAAFQIESRSTLAINCLPMGVGFSSERMTVATTSVREDMAVALVKAFGACYDQLVLVADPLFMKRLLDYASAQGTDWSRHRVHVVLGEEIFGEHFRTYVASCLRRDPSDAENGYIMSSFGVGELGLHLCYETPAAIALRRAAHCDLAFARDLFGIESSNGLPMVLTFNPPRTFIEIVSPDAAGYGALTFSMLDAELPIPLLRYQTGDVARLLDPGEIAAACRRHNVAVPEKLPEHLLALMGRSRESLPYGSHVGVFKDALYADHRRADLLTGAFRVEMSGAAITMHVQLAPSTTATPSLERRLLEAIPEPVRPASVILWPYERFPFGMTLDYERKFKYAD
jgi:phenylacetate-CoA ligase